jgi:adenine-specific DNA-methyltransferase
MEINYDDWSKKDLIKELKKFKRRKKYGIVWDQERIKEVFDKEVEGKLPVLQEIKNKEIFTNSNDPTNILIEGDNYHALSVLNFTHKKKIDLIYIDPPYNTGAKDWKYNNDFVDKEDSYRHSKWLSLIHNRLRLAKSLLKKDGMLIITIDDNELFHLGTLLEDMFPAHDLFVITIEHNKRGRRGKNFAKTNEWAIFLVPSGMELIQEEQLDVEIGGETRNLRRTGSGSKRTERPRKFYPIWVNKKTLKVVSAGDPISVDQKWKYEEKKDLVTLWPIDKKGIEKNWHYGVERTRKCIQQKELEVREQDYGLQVYYTLRKKTSKKYKTVWTGSKFDASTHGSVLLERILGVSGSFDYPKSLYAVLECLIATVGNRKSATVLDFFAGSGTTGHAVLELNEEDDGNRQFILCTNNENNIATDVCYPRIKNIIHGYSYDDVQIAELGGNLKYFKTAFVNSELTDQNKKKLVERCTEMLCLKENCFKEIKSEKNFKIFRNHLDRYLGIIYDDAGIHPFRNQILKLNKKINTYVFSLDESAREEEFEDVKNMVELKPIPEAILNVYRSIFK